MWSARSSCDDHLDGATHHVRIDPVQLEGPGLLVGAEPDHVHGLAVPLDHGPGGDHLADVEPGAELPAQPPETGVRDAGHRGEYDRWPDLVLTDRQDLRPRIGCGRPALRSGELLRGGRRRGDGHAVQCPRPYRPRENARMRNPFPDLPAEPAADRPDLLAEPVRLALPEGSGALVAPIDPELADTAAFCAAYEVAARGVGELCRRHRASRDGEQRWAAALVLATTRADVNGAIRRRVDVRKISFASMDDAVEHDRDGVRRDHPDRAAVDVAGARRQRSARRGSGGDRLRHPRVEADHRSRRACGPAHR